MPESLGHYGFIPWLRQGVASKIKETDTLGIGSGSSVERANVVVDVILRDTEVEDGSNNEHTIAKKVELYGPGDVIGVSQRAILRTEPPASVQNFEPNLLPYIEFYEEDFPWRYTPARPAISGANTRKLRSWLALVVLKDDEFTLNVNANGLSTILIADDKINGAFYDHKQIWAWSHVHLNNDLEDDAGQALIDEVSSELDQDPDSGISRMICPRKLQKKYRLHRILIPAFETGRLAGLGESTTDIKAQEPSWMKVGNNIITSDTQKNIFPFYYHWKFGTGALGDFESLVSILKPVVTKPETGKLPMDIQDPGFNMQGMANSETIGMEGALKPPAFEPDQFPDGEGDEDFVAKLQEIVNLAVNISEDSASVSLDNPFYSAPVVDDPIIVPPIYGYWHSLIKKVGGEEGEESNPNWVDQLNLDPRFRGTAGLGTQVIQKLQEKLMHRAWQQIGDVKEANQKIKEAQLSKIVNTCIFKKHLTNANGNRFTALTNATHNFLIDTSNSKTINKVFKDSKVPVVAKSAAFRRVVRPGKKSNRSINRVSTVPLHQEVVKNFNKDEGAITAAKLKVSPESSITFGNVNNAIQGLQDEYEGNDHFMAKDLIFTVLNDLLPDNINNLNPLKNSIDGASGFSNGAKNLAKEGIDGLIKSSFTKNGSSVSVKMQKATFKKIFGENDNLTDIPTSKTYKRVTISRDPDPNETEWEGKVTTLSDIINFGSSFQSLVGVTSQTNFARPEDRQKSAIPQINTVFGHLKAQLNPNLTLDKKVRRRISAFRGNTKPIKPIMAHPKYEEAMYEEVKKISQDFILPNVELLLENSITILQTNQRFIEAYMAGLNHEMARELLWREYPTDQRGSYFRQFWDTEDNLFEDNPEMRLDIQKMHTWQGNLGGHAMQNPEGGYLVLVVRGQLLIKYPNTMIYAQKAQYDPENPTGERILPTTMTETNTRFPVFSARLEPDIFLFGFALNLDQAAGERAELGDSPQALNGKNPGWFFVFKERPGQIKFGLDDYVDDFGNDDVMPEGAPETWNDLSWEHLVNNKQDLESYFINFDTPVNITDPPPGKPNPQWGDNSADLASILYQNPVIFARHAQEMLPEDDE